MGWDCHVNSNKEMTLSALVFHIHTRCSIRGKQAAIPRNRQRVGPDARGGSLILYDAQAMKRILSDAEKELSPVEKKKYRYFYNGLDSYGDTEPHTLFLAFSDPALGKRCHNAIKGMEDDMDIARFLSLICKPKEDRKLSKKVQKDAALVALLDEVGPECMETRDEEERDYGALEGGLHYYFNE